MVSPSAGNRKYCSVPCRDKDPEFKRNCWIQNNLDLQRRKAPTSLELAGRELLTGLGIAFAEQVLVSGKFTVDVMFDGVPLVIQWDGDYWHGYRAPGDDRPVEDRIKARMRLDVTQNKFMRNRGLIVLRFWEHEVMENRAAVEAKILSALESYKASLGHPDLFAAPTLPLGDFTAAVT